MIHKRNATLTALALTLAIAVVFFFFPRIYHGPLGVYYLPSLVLAVFISHFTTDQHFPPEYIGWISFAVYTIFYFVIFLLIYVLILEIYILRKVLHYLDDAKEDLDPDQADSQKALEKIGSAIIEAEAQRRRHFLLKPVDAIDLKKAPHLLAAESITASNQPPFIRKLLKKLQSRLSTGSTPIQASVKMSNLKKDATALLSKKPNA